jgi:DnaK suppressor protein
LSPIRNLRVTTKKKETKKPAAACEGAHFRLGGGDFGSSPDHQFQGAHRAGHRKVKAEWQKYYDRLLELREQLMQQMNGLAKESAQEIAGYSLHMADSGTDNFDRDFALSLLSSDQDAVYEIEEALKRIERDTYGVCELTGKAIPKARLEAIPWARFTVRPKRNWNAKAPCASAVWASWAPWMPPPRRMSKRIPMTGRKKSRPKKKNKLNYAARNHHHRMHGSPQGG